MKKTGTLLSFSALCIFMGILTGPLALAEGIKVGVLLPLTGKLAYFGDIERKSFLMAANEINKAGGIHGEPIHLIIKNTEGKPATGKSAMDKLIRKDGVCIVGGGFSSSVTWATSKLAQKNKIPFLINTASADKITEKGGDYMALEGRDEYLRTPRAAYASVRAAPQHKGPDRSAGGPTERLNAAGANPLLGDWTQTTKMPKPNQPYPDSKASWCAVTYLRSTRDCAASAPWGRDVGRPADQPSREPNAGLGGASAASGARSGSGTSSCR